MVAVLADEFHRVDSRPRTSQFRSGPNLTSGIRASVPLRSCKLFSHFVGVVVEVQHHPMPVGGV